MFVGAAGLAVAFAGLAWFGLPRTPPAARIGYGALMGSILDWCASSGGAPPGGPGQALLFAAFNAFWTTLALLVEAPPFGLDPAGAGLFGLIGAAGASALRSPGASPIRAAPGRVLVGGAVLTLAAFVVFGLFGGHSLVALAVGVLLVDIGINTALIANQTRVYALAPGRGGGYQHGVLHRDLRRRGARRLGRHRAFAAGGWPASAPSAAPSRRPPCWCPCWSRANALDRRARILGPSPLPCPAC